jgi:hypothetical protein
VHGRADALRDVFPSGPYGSPPAPAHASGPEMVVVYVPPTIKGWKGSKSFETDP